MLGSASTRPSKGQGVTESFADGEGAPQEKQWRRDSYCKGSALIAPRIPDGGRPAVVIPAAAAAAVVVIIIVVVPVLYRRG